MDMEAEFHPTHWTLVMNAGGATPEAKEALSELCAIYYRPVVSFIHRAGRNEDEAREVAHAFFEKVLEEGVGRPDRERGRFRNYLLGALKHFLSRRRDAMRAIKRGGEVEHVSLAAEGDSLVGHLVLGVSDDALVFDREWAAALIGRALINLEAEQVGKEAQFSVLKPWLETAETRPQFEAAHELGISGAAVKVAIHRLRVRFRELIRAEVSSTVADPVEVGEEFLHLIEVTSGR